MAKSRTKTIITKSLALLALLAVLAGCEITAKTASPDPVTVGEQLTFTIDVAFEEDESAARVEDELPDSVRFVSASTDAAGGCDFIAVDNTVRCTVANPSFPAEGTATITIAVTPTECGTFTNTAFIPNEDPEGESVSFTVVGCEEVPGQQGTPAPITQDTEQEAESGDINQSFDVSQTGDNSDQCAGLQGVSNTGNSQNVTDLLQATSEADDFEFDEVGSDITVSPGSPTTCDQQVNQAATAAG